MTGKVNVVELRTRQSLLFEWFHYSWFRSVPNNDEVGFRGEISERNWDVFLDVFADHLDVVLQLGRDGNDGRALGDCALNETQNLKKKTSEYESTFFVANFQTQEQYTKSNYLNLVCGKLGRITRPCLAIRQKLAASENICV